MIIGHLPAGYVISRLLFSRFAATGVSARAFLWAGAIGALAPDFDMLYFYLVDQRQHHHHSYVTHFPIVWFAILVCSLAWLIFAKIRSRAALAAIFAINGMAHMVFDTVVGDIWWFAPLVDKPFVLFNVPALYTPWWLNFLLHWSFGVEIAMILWAVYLFRRRME